MVGAFDPADCILPLRDDLESASSVGNKLMYHRNFRASKIASIWHFSGGRGFNIIAYLEKRHTSKELNRAVQKLHLSGINQHTHVPGSELSSDFDIHKER